MSTLPFEPAGGDFRPQRPPLVAIAGSVLAALLGVALGFWLTPAFPYESNALGPQLAQPGAAEASAPQAMDADAGSRAPADDPGAALPRAPG